VSVVYLVATPDVGADYRAFFIERSSDCFPHPVYGTLELGRRVSFREADATGAAAGLKVCGWIEATPNGTYSTGPEARLLFRVDGEPAPLRLELDMLPFVTSSHGQQRVRIAANGAPLAVLELDAQSSLRQTVVIPAGIQGADGRIELSLTFPDARSPKELGINADRRRLAVRLISLELSRAGERHGAK